MSNRTPRGVALKRPYATFKVRSWHAVRCSHNQTRTADAEQSALQKYNHAATSVHHTNAATNKKSESRKKLRETKNEKRQTVAASSRSAITPTEPPLKPIKPSIKMVVPDVTNGIECLQKKANNLGDRRN